MAITNFISTVWSENLYKQLDTKYVAVANCNREWEGEIKQKGDRVKILGVGPIAIQDYTKNTDLSNPPVLNDNVRELVIDQAKAFNFQIDDIDRAQATPHLMEAAMKNAASALANEADRYVYSLYSHAANEIYVPSATPETIIDKLIDARTLLCLNNVTDPKDIIFEVSPRVAGLILKGKVKLSTDNGEALENGCIGSIAGCKIYVSNNISYFDNAEVVEYRCLARTKRAIAFAEQLSEIDAYRPELRFADAVKGLHLYGAKVVYPAEMVVLNVEVNTEE